MKDKTSQALETSKSSPESSDSLQWIEIVRQLRKRTDSADLRSLVFSKVGWLTVRSVPEIHSLVVAEWGPVSLRHVARIVAELLRDGRIEIAPSDGVYGYRLTLSERGARSGR